MSSYKVHVMVVEIYIFMLAIVKIHMQSDKLQSHKLGEELIVAHPFTRIYACRAGWSRAAFLCGRGSL
jgi:hypothetical protein